MSKIIASILIFISKLERFKHQLRRLLNFKIEMVNSKNCVCVLNKANLI